jgi:hypothetical protein
VAEAVGDPLGEGEVPTAGAVVVEVVVAGDIVVVAGDIAGAVAPGTAGTAGVMAGAVVVVVVAGLIAVVGGGPGGLAAVDVGGAGRTKSARE